MDWMDNVNTWTGLPVEESIRMTEDRDKWRKNVYGVANHWIEDALRIEQNGPSTFKIETPHYIHTEVHHLILSSGPTHLVLR